MTYREAILLGESILQKAKIVDAKNDAWLLLAMACRIDHTYYYVHMDEEMSQEQIREYQALLSKRAERISAPVHSRRGRSLWDSNSV